MKKGLPEIRESVSELKHPLRTEKKARRKERLQMLYLFRTGQAKNHKSAAQILSVRRTTVSCWLDAYERAGLDCMLHIGFWVSISHLLQFVLFVFGQYYGIFPHCHQLQGNHTIVLPKYSIKNHYLNKTDRRYGLDIGKPEVRELLAAKARDIAARGYAWIRWCVSG